MPDLKEKLVDDICGKLMGLLQRAPYIRCEDVHRQYAVNWLMNNGVTVQEWISVKDRLPKEEGLYLVAVVNNHERRYSKTAWYHGHGNWFLHQKVTHWQYLPQPPKGE